MPYIQEFRRAALRDGAKMKGPGELNYLLTVLVMRFLAGGISYDKINTIMETFDKAIDKCWTERNQGHQAAQGKKYRAIFPSTKQELLAGMVGLVADYRGSEKRDGSLGALRSAQQEFYRRVVGPYEDVKQKENGDVY